MFDFVRGNNKVLQIILFFLIVPSFAFFGLEGYNRMRDAGDPAATVAGQVITQAEWDAAHKAEVERYKASMPSADVRQFDTPEFKRAILDRLAKDRVMAAHTNDLKVTVGDAKLAREIQQDPSIAALRKADGTIDKDRYKQIAGAQGLTPEGLEARVRGELAKQQVARGVEQSSFLPAAASSTVLGAVTQRREVSTVDFANSSFKAQASATDAELEAYYKANVAKFKTQELADVEYITLSLDALSQGISITEADAKKLYDENKGRFQAPEERRASHILITAAKDASDADKTKARTKAEQLQAQVLKAPATFAEVAKANSQDPGSAVKGGDLDFFGRGAMVKPFEEAAYALKKGEISKVVQSDFGFHVIQLNDLRGGEVKPFEAVRAEIEGDLRKQQAQKKFAEAAEGFSNSVYEQSDSFKAVAEKYKLEIKTHAGITRKGLPGNPQPKAVQPTLSNAKLVEKLFSADSIAKKRNTEAVETGASQLTSARIVKYQDAKTRSLDEVKAEVREAVLQENAQKAAQKAGEAKLAEGKAKPAELAGLSAAKTVSRQDPQGLHPTVLQAAFKAPTAMLPALVGVEVPGIGYTVVRVDKVLTAAVEADAAKAAAQKQQEAQLKQQLQQAWGRAEFAAYQSMLDSRYNLKIKASKTANWGGSADATATAPATAPAAPGSEPKKN